MRDKKKDNIWKKKKTPNEVARNGLVKIASKISVYFSGLTTKLTLLCQILELFGGGYGHLA